QKLAPATYACIVSNGRIMFGGLLDFGRASFEDFEQLSPQSRIFQYFVVQRCSIVVNSLDGLYRAVHYFPDDNTGEFKKNMKRLGRVDKVHFKRVNPTREEFIALMGLAMWSDDISQVNDGLMQLVRRNRAAILDDLHKHYVVIGMPNYAARLGELVEEDMHIYRMMNMFNE
ncbi:hypothetical protein PFISCL1PPCAC_13224, partial [Pristionchus fissidentatus]